MVGVGVLMCVVLLLVDVLLGSGCLLFVRFANIGLHQGFSVVTEKSLWKTRGGLSLAGEGGTKDRPSQFWLFRGWCFEG